MKKHEILAALRYEHGKRLATAGPQNNPAETSAPLFAQPQPV